MLIQLFLNVFENADCFASSLEVMRRTPFDLVLGTKILNLVILLLHLLQDSKCGISQIVLIALNIFLEIGIKFVWI